MVRKFYEMSVGIHPMVRIPPLLIMGIIGAMEGRVVIPALYLSACIIIFYNMLRKL